MMTDDAYDEDDQQYDGPSRSQRKRDALAVLDLVRTLCELTDPQLAKLSLPEDLHRQIVDSRRITSMGARKRQLQFLAKQIRRADVDLEPILEALDSSREGQRKETARLHRLEAWRDALLEQGDSALGVLLDTRPEIDRQHLRALIRMANDETRQQRAPAASRQIFKLLRELEAGEELPAPPRAEP